MTTVSGALALVAALLLALGAAGGAGGAGGAALVYTSIALCALSAVLLLAGVARRS